LDNLDRPKHDNEVRNDVDAEWRSGKYWRYQRLKYLKIGINEEKNK